MYRSPHRRKRVPKPGADYLVPFGKRTRTPHANGLKPGDIFVDPKGRRHTVPDKGKPKRAKKERP